MPKPVVADIKPKKAGLEQRKEYFWCRCGRSKQDCRNFAARVREISGGIPVGFKLSANHIERDMALLSGVRFAGVLPPR